MARKYVPLKEQVHKLKFEIEGLKAEVVRVRSWASHWKVLYDTAMNLPTINNLNLFPQTEKKEEN